jgi:hypothetical protein
MGLIATELVSRQSVEKGHALHFASRKTASFFAVSD